MFYTYAKFGIQGYVGAVRTVGKTLKVRVSKTESWKNKESGERQDRTIWNTLTVFERTPGFAWIKENLKVGDLVMVEGQVSETSYEKDGATVYETTLAVDLLAVIPTGKGE